MRLEVVCSPSLFITSSTFPLKRYGPVKDCSLKIFLEFSDSFSGDDFSTVSLLVSIVSARSQDRMSVVCCKPLACDSQFAFTLSLSSGSCSLSGRAPSCSSSTYMVSISSLLTKAVNMCSIFTVLMVFVMAFPQSWSLVMLLFACS